MRYCHRCEKCAHDVKLRAAHMNLASLDVYVRNRVKDADVCQKIIDRAEGSFVEARLLVDLWLRDPRKAMFDTKDHILKCQIEFYDSLLHGMSHVGLVILALVAVKVPFRFEELADAVHVLTGEKIIMSSLLRETRHPVEIEWEKVPIVKECHENVMTFIREEAELPEIDMVELCRLGIEHDGEFCNYALRNWSKFCLTDDKMFDEGRLRNFDNYLKRFEDEFREKTFRALNDDDNVKFYGTHVDHLKAWHGLHVTSDTADQRGNFPIHIAASRGHSHLMQNLAHSKDREDGRGRTAFQVAFERRKLDVCEKLPFDLSVAMVYDKEYAKSKIMSDTNNLAALHTVIELGRREIVAKSPDSLRYHHASRALMLLRKMPELLKDAGIDKHLLQHAYRCPSPLHNASFEKSKSLLEHANACDSDGKTPLWDAVEKRDHQRIDLLLKHTDVNLVAHNGMTIVEHAWHVDKDIALGLVDNIQGLRSVCLTLMLDHAIKQNRQNSVKTLVMKGADLWDYADVGSLPSETARSNGANTSTEELVRQIEQIFIKVKPLQEIQNLKVDEDGTEIARICRQEPDSVADQKFLNRQDLVSTLMSSVDLDGDQKLSDVSVGDNMTTTPIVQPHAPALVSVAA